LTICFKCIIYRYTCLEAPRTLNTVAQIARPRRQQQRAVETRTAIIHAALSEFASLGFDGATTRGIAERAKVNHRLIGHHFGDKEALWKATAEHVFGVYAERLQQRQRGLEGVDEQTLVRLLLREFILFSAAVPEFHRFMMQANQGDPVRLNWLVDRFLAPGSAVELEVLRRAQEVGLFPPGDATHLRYMFIGAATSIFAFATEFKRISGTDAFDEAVVERHVDLVFNLFRRTGEDG